MKVNDVHSQKDEEQQLGFIRKVNRERSCQGFLSFPSWLDARRKDFLLLPLRKLTEQRNSDRDPKKKEFRAYLFSPFPSPVMSSVVILSPYTTYPTSVLTFRVSSTPWPSSFVDHPSIQTVPTTSTVAVSLSVYLPPPDPTRNHLHPKKSNPVRPRCLSSNASTEFQTVPSSLNTLCLQLKLYQKADPGHSTQTQITTTITVTKTKTQEDSSSGQTCIKFVHTTDHRPHPADRGLAPLYVLLTDGRQLLRNGGDRLGPNRRFSNPNLFGPLTCPNIFSKRKEGMSC